MFYNTELQITRRGRMIIYRTEACISRNSMRRISTWTPAQRTTK